MNKFKKIMFIWLPAILMSGLLITTFTLFIIGILNFWWWLIILLLFTIMFVGALGFVEYWVINKKIKQQLQGGEQWQK